MRLKGKILFLGVIQMSVLLPFSGLLRAPPLRMDVSSRLTASFHSGCTSLENRIGWSSQADARVMQHINLDYQCYNYQLSPNESSI